MRKDIYDSFFAKIYQKDPCDPDQKFSFEVEKIDAEIESYFFFFFNKRRDFGKVEIKYSSLTFPKVILH